MLFTAGNRRVCHKSVFLRDLHGGGCCCSPTEASLQNEIHVLRIKWQHSVCEEMTDTVGNLIVITIFLEL